MAGTRKKKQRQVELSHAYSEDEDDQREVDVAEAIDRFSKRLSQQKKYMEELKESNDFLGKSFDDLKKSIQKIAKEHKQMQKEIQQLKTNEKEMNDKIQHLEQHVLKTKQSANASDMVVTNLPRFDSPMELENAIKTIAKQVGHELRPDEIISIRQNENKKFSTYPIIVKLNGKLLKDKCMKFRRDRNKIDAKQIKSNMEMNGKNINFHHVMEKEFSELFNKVKLQAKDKNYKYVWIQEATILIRKMDNAKPIAINSIGDLEKII